MDTIFIRSLEADTIIGIHAHELNTPQRVVIDLDMASDTQRAARSRDIRDAVDYQRVAERLVRYLEASRCLLVETLAEELASIVMREFQVPWLRLTLTKPDALPAATRVGITIERGERPGSSPSDTAKLADAG